MKVMIILLEEVKVKDSGKLEELFYYFIEKELEKIIEFQIFIFLVIFFFFGKSFVIILFECMYKLGNFCEFCFLFKEGFVYEFKFQYCVVVGV